jgi:hypothetical protein
MSSSEGDRSSAALISRINAALQQALLLEEEEGPEGAGGAVGVAPTMAAAAAAASGYEEAGTLLEDDEDMMEQVCGSQIASSDNLLERSKYIPLRLTYEERKALRLVNAAINVSNYTTAVDREFKSQQRRHFAQLQHICAFLSGLVAAADYGNGQDVLLERSFGAFEAYLQNVLEIARRYKVMNPEKMRSEYGKLIYLLQDANSTEIKSLLSVDVHTPIKTVYAFLEARGGLAVLSHASIGMATREILPDKSLSREAIQRQIKLKERAVEAVVRSGMSRALSADDIRMCLYSICDNNSFLNSNLLPIEECISQLIKYFNPSLPEFAGSASNSSSSPYSLCIRDGTDGARLSHSHLHQYSYVLQSLTLWSITVQDMFRLWYLAELDLLDPAHPYELKHTGQGMHRVQHSPRTYRAMHEILHHTKKRLCEAPNGVEWIGSSVIHLGDHNVPNALVFIDKYTQVSRILNPVIQVLKNLEAACAENAGLNRYIESYGGLEKARKDVLHDFFTHAFDGSGGDNFFDAGSCIDGRLTSAWHWCSQLFSKPYYPLFRLTGFLSFDGEFDK